MSAAPQVSPAVDEDGFLTHPEEWTREVAMSLARDDGFEELTQAHWAIIDGLREYYFRHGGVPAFSHICHINHMGNHCVEELFRNRPREAWRIAGLPNPGEEAKTYM